MDNIFISLDIQEQEFEALQSLPYTWTPFSVPSLEEKPQNPIIETLRLSRTQNVTIEDELVPQDLPFPHEDQVETGSDHVLKFALDGEDVWGRAVSVGDLHLDATTSWDTLRKAYACQVTPSCFLSQQTERVLSSARRTIGDNLGDNVNLDDIFNCIQALLRGIPSSFFLWEEKTQTFHLRSVRGEAGSTLTIPGMSHVVSDSFMTRFLKIGTLVRRLEILITGVWQSPSHLEPAVHAFMHAVSTILDHIKTVLANVEHSASRVGVSQAFASLSTACADVEEQLEVIASLCGCSIDDHPSEYSDTFLSQSATHLLSRVYQSLDGQIKGNSTRNITAITAFILSTISSDHFDKVCRRVGYSESGIHKSKIISQRTNSVPFEDSDEGEAEEQPGSDDEEDDKLPCFYRDSLAQALSNAHRSLKLLRIACPDHPLLDSATSYRRPIRWFWSAADVSSAWLGSDEPPNEPKPPSQYIPTKQTLVPAVADVSYPPDFLEFERFDLEPGANIFEAKTDKTPPHIPHYSGFLTHFPDNLPSLTPTLPHLTELVLAPLTSHVEALSTALLDIFLSPASGHLKFSSHLVLLRSFLLLASPSLKNRLEGSLFSNEVGYSAIGMASPRATLKRRKDTVSPWIIGLAPGLMAGSGWPPGGADLSFLLRTVILDALDHEYPSRQLGERRLATEDHADESIIYDEAEWRIGFAVRDLPTGTGQAKWLNPRSIEALDFLYMNYQPPPALDVLIPPSTLSKYHRLFVFNIRLLRVENVVKALYRMSSPGSDPLFQTITPSQKLFEHFRFITSSFVSTLSSYVYDTAIGGNFDAFLSKLDNTNQQNKGQELPSFSSVFSLAEGHSKLMDDVLSACLMRSAQKPVGDLLRSVLDVILEFGILMGDLSQGQIQEYHAAGPLEDLYSSFRKKMITLVKVLRSLVDKGTMSSKITFEDMRLQILSGHSPRGVGVTANLFDLLIRLDAGQWWMKQSRR